MNNFGGNWTQEKIDIVVDYAKAYLIIMNKYPQFKTLYFDGFAGSGDIFREDDTDIEVITGAAIRILEIDSPKSFDMYYFVEKDEKNELELKEAIAKRFPKKISKCHIANDDCNNKLIRLANFLRGRPEYRVLAFIDPYGMAVNWSSLEALKGLGVDLWILVPTGMGINRLLKNDYNISDAWLSKLEKFLGMPRNDVLNYFYKQKKSYTLFGEETITQKESDAITKAGELYKERLNTLFEFVSKPFIMQNSNGAIMYHFMMASNNKTAQKIANDVIKPKYEVWRNQI